MVDEVKINSRHIDWQARTRGNWDYLATYIADEANPITKEIRTLLVDIIKGDLKRPRRRPDKDSSRDAQLIVAVLNLESQGWKRTAAIMRICELFSVSEKTVKRAFKEPPWWDEALEAVEDVWRATTEK